ncbi:hypothetical protein [Haloarcula montana]|uniref:hypothetical protein n=1 Tax=Haloarcula montana TaxID=3111776 RepID=UPI002D769DF9|nr:hypothetical protein [Haloarcula sp. GH36]
MPTLSYSGRVAVATTTNGKLPAESAERMHTLLNKAITAYEGETVDLKKATVHFDGEPIIEIEVASQAAELAELEAVQDELAQTVVEIGMEDSAADAAEKIRLD